MLVSRMGNFLRGWILGNHDDSLLLLSNNYIQMLRNEPQRRRDTETLEVEFRAVFGWPVLARPRAGRAGHPLAHILDSASHVSPAWARACPHVGLPPGRRGPVGPRARAHAKARSFDETKSILAKPLLIYSNTPMLASRCSTTVWLYIFNF
jgi:hypothetical protein